jgi:hypothetical protein
MCGTDETRIIHKSPFADWYATQDMPRGVSIYDRNSDEKTVVEPPAEWGRDWSWSVTEDGTGVLQGHDGHQQIANVRGAAAGYNRRAAAALERRDEGE